MRIHCMHSVCINYIILMNNTIQLSMCSAVWSVTLSCVEHDRH